MKVTLSEIIALFHVTGPSVFIDNDFASGMLSGGVGAADAEMLKKLGVSSLFASGFGVRGLHIETVEGKQVCRHAEVYLKFHAFGPGMNLDENLLRALERGAVYSITEEELAKRGIDTVQAVSHGFHALDTDERFALRLGAVRGDKPKDNVESINKPQKKAKKKAAPKSKRGGK